MTQSPTPGPLSGDDWTAHSGAEVPIFNTNVDVMKRDGSEWANVHSGQWGQDWLWSYDDMTNADIVGWRPSLAPTAPVEASGSELTDLLERLRTIDNGTVKERPWIATELCDEAANALEALRPQPSGETRALLERATEIANDVERGKRPKSDAVDMVRTLRDLLSARPLALGGQQGVDRGRVEAMVREAVVVASVDVPDKFADRVATRFEITQNATDAILAALSTTPARAEAQDEGAAGDLQQALTLALALLWQMEPTDARAVSDEFVAMAAAQAGIQNQEGRDIIAARLKQPIPSIPAEVTFTDAHPSPTTAADDDRVREALARIVKNHGAYIERLPGATGLSDLAFARAALKSTAAKEGGE